MSFDLGDAPLTPCSAITTTVERAFRVRAFQDALDTLPLPDGSGSVQPVGYTPSRRPERGVRLVFHGCDATVEARTLLSDAAGCRG
jgi:hypothetical protein